MFVSTLSEAPPPLSAFLLANKLEALATKYKGMGFDTFARSHLPQTAEAMRKGSSEWQGEQILLYYANELERLLTAEKIWK